MNHKKTAAIVSSFVSKEHKDILSSLIKDLGLSVLGIDYCTPKPFTNNIEIH